MARVPIVEIPVDDSEFKKFSAAFEDYLGKLKTMPADWQAVNSRIGELAKVQRALGVSSDRAWSNAVSAASNYERVVRQATSAEQHLGRGAGSAAMTLARMEKHAKGVATSLLGAVRSMAKFATFGLGGGLLGLGGLAFGLDRLADAVLTRQRTARGLGITPGQLKSFQVNMAGIAGGNVLEGAAEAQADAAQQGWLATLRINPQAAANESATKLAGQEIMNLHRALRGVPTGILFNTAAAQAAMHLGFSREDIRRIHETSGVTLQRQIAAVGRDAPALGFSAQVAREWSQFSIELHRAGALIESALIRTLAPLAGPLDNLSKSIANLITGLAKSGELKDWINGLAGEIQKFSQFLGSPAFRKDLAEFATDVGDVARGLERALIWLGLIPAKPATTAQLGASQTTPEHMTMASRAIARDEIMNRRVAGQYSIGAVSDLIAKDSAKYGVPVKLMSRIAQAESHYGQGKLISPAGAEGIFQVMPETGRGLGYSDMLDPEQNAAAAFRYMRRLLARYHGDKAEAVAAYNWGPANVDRDIREHGAQWKRFLPAETRAYLGEVLPGTELPAPSAEPKTRTPVFPGGTLPSIARGTIPTPTAAPPAPHQADVSGRLPAGQSDIARVRARHWQTRQGVKVKIENNSSSQAFVSANAAAQ